MHQSIWSSNISSPLTPPHRPPLRNPWAFEHHPCLRGEERNWEEGGGGRLRKKDFERTSLQKFKRLELLVTGFDWKPWFFLSDRVKIPTLNVIVQCVALGSGLKDPLLKLGCVIEIAKHLKLPFFCYSSRLLVTNLWTTTLVSVPR